MFKKRIGILHYTAPKIERGGVESVITKHIEHLQNDYDIQLIYGKGGGGWGREIELKQIPLLDASHPEIKEIQEIIMKGHINEHMEKFNLLKEKIKNELFPTLDTVNTLIIHNIPSMPFNFPLLVALNELVDELVKKRGYRVIFWLHDSIAFREEWRDRLEEFPFDQIHHFNEKIIYITPTNYRAKQFKELPRKFRLDNVEVIYNGIDVEEYLKIDAITAGLREKLNISLEDYVLLVPVRITPRKNLELAFKIAGELKYFWKDLKVIVTGPVDNQATVLGENYLIRLKELIKNLNLEENVIFCYDIIDMKRVIKNGTIIKWSVSDIYNLADIILVPSKEEGFGLPIIEAGTVRKPVFCSRIKPFEELIREGIEGHMFSLDESPKTIAFRIIQYMINDVVNMNFRNVIQHFTWGKIIKNKIIPII